MKPINNSTIKNYSISRNLPSYSKISAQTSKSKSNLIRTWISSKLISTLLIRIKGKWALMSKNIKRRSIFWQPICHVSIKSRSPTKWKSLRSKHMMIEARKMLFIAFAAPTQWSGDSNKSTASWTRNWWKLRIALTWWRSRKTWWTGTISSGASSVKSSSRSRKSVAC